MTICKYCGTRNQATLKVCIKCGRVLEHSTPHRAPVNAPHAKTPPVHKSSEKVHRASRYPSKSKKSKTDSIILFLIIILSMIFVIGASLVAFKSCTPKHRNHSANMFVGGASNVTYTIKFNLNYDNPDIVIPDESVNAGSYLICPYVVRDDYFLVGWYTESQCYNKFDFSSPVNSDYDLYAYWVDMKDVTDTDGEGLTDVMEIAVGTDVNVVDTDGDELSDYVEVVLLGYDPLNTDTDGDGILDGDEDLDADKLINKQETTYKTVYYNNDTDVDELDDGEEVYDYKTDPLLPDTDGDKAFDGAEVRAGTDPCAKDFIFNNISVDSQPSSSDPSFSASTIINGITDGSALNTLSVKESTLFGSDMPGYMGPGYEFNCDSDFTSATLNFTYDSTRGNYTTPTICYYNEKTGELEPLDTKLVNIAGTTSVVATTEVTHFSTYVLVDRYVYEEAFTWQDTWTTASAEVVLVIDDSGSMSSNDPNKARLSVAKTLINNLPDNCSIGVVRFDDGAVKLTSSMTRDKDSATNYLTEYYFDSNGSTYMYEGIALGMSLYQTDDSDIPKILVLLSDGEASDTYNDANIKQTAIANDITIYSVGLGNDSYNIKYFNNVLKPLAEETGGIFRHASEADDLIEIYDDIGDEIDLETDADGDGVPDHYELNMISFNGVKLELDVNNPDTDGDGLLDGQEVIVQLRYNEDKTKVSVFGQVISDPTNRDTDNDGIPDNIDTAPRNKGLKDGIVGALTICSYSEGAFSSGEASGHSYLAYTSFVNDSKYTTGVFVDDSANVLSHALTRADHKIDMMSMMVTTISGLGANIERSARGTWINNEYYLFESADDIPDNQASITVYLTDDQVEVLFALAALNNSWDTIYNSAAFASRLWNSVVGDNLASESRILTPGMLAEEIMTREGSSMGSYFSAPMP